ncbi:MAG: PKD domain-containing protein [Myxococcales bacterium]|nr:PKD domain-containing protein [Myxococcales bacterium]
MIRKAQFSWGATLLLLGLTGAAHAGLPVNVEILSPGQGQCVNNGDRVGTGGIVGGEALPSLRDVPVRLRLTSVGGTSLSVTFTSRFELFTVRVDFPPGQEEIVTDAYSLPAFLVEDAANTSLEVIVRSVDNPNLTARDTVDFMLDRTPPRLQVNTELGDLDECSAAAPVIDLQPVDTFDQNPMLESRVELVGCRRRQIFTTRDACGNAQEYEHLSRRPGDPATITAALRGYRCGVDGLCVTQGPDAVPFSPGDRIGRGTIVFDFQGPDGCIDQVNASLIRAEDYVENCPAFEDIEPDPDGNIVDPCPILVPGQAIEEAGDYVARLVVSSCEREIIRDEIDFTILDRPTANAGGPYVVTQGDTVMLDGSRSEVAPELGGIVSYAWDLNRDGFFDPGELGDDINQNGIRDPWEVDRQNDGFDFAADLDGNGQIEGREVFSAQNGQVRPVPLETELDGVYQVRLRVTGGNGAESIAAASLTVRDVDPDCQLGGPYEGFEGVPVVFDASASSEGHFADPIIAWNWDFGDGVRPQRGDNLTNPAHIFRQAGEYTVTLALEDIDSIGECETTVTITEVLPVVEGIAALDQSPLEGRPIRFTAGDTRPGSDSDPILNYRWQFGNGEEQNGAALREPVQAFADDGVYEVCLTVADEDSEASGCFDIVIADLMPTAVFDAPAQAVEGQPVMFDAEGTIAGGPADALARIEWDFGDGEPPVVVDDLDDPDSFLMEHTFRRNGRYTVTLTAYDEDSEVSFRREIVIDDTRPRAALDVLYPAGQRSGVEGDPLEFDASRSTPGADRVVDYRWSFGDGTNQTTQVPRVTHVYQDDGSYQVRVTVVDEDGSTESAELIADVANRDPVIRLVANETQVELGQEVRFRTVVNGNVPPSPTPQIAVVVDDVAADLPPLVVEWDFGDGGISTELSPTHRFAELGELTVRVLIEDKDGGMAEAELEIEVTAAAPRIQQVAEQQVAEGATLEFSVLVEAPPLGEGFATLDVNIPGLPPGAMVEIVPEGNNRRVDVTWTPTYYQAGRYQLQVRAAALEVARSDRTRTVTIVVTEAGTPRLAAVGGTSGRGVVTLFDYSANQFRAVAEVELGLGGGGLAAQPDGQRVFVAVPGSNRVAVVQATAPLRQTPLRRIPVGRTPSAVAAGMGHMWVVNSGDDTLSIIDTATLKVVRSVSLAPLAGPSDIAWLGAGFEGLQAPRLAVVSRRSGHVAIVDPDAALAGRAAIVGQVRLGGILTRIVADPVTGWLHVADAKTRRIYRIAAADVATSAANAADGVRLAFAPIDLAHQGETLFVATGNGLVRVTDDGAVTAAEALVEAQALTTADDQILSGGALVVASPTRIDNLAPQNLAPQLGAASARVRRMVTFVARED